MAAHLGGAAPPAVPAPAPAPPTINGDWDPEKWEEVQVQEMCNDAREHRERMGAVKEHVGHMTIDGGTTWFQIVLHGAGKVGAGRTVPAALVGGANGGNTTLADRDGWYFYIDNAGNVARNPGGIETYLTQAGLSGKDRYWIKACIFAAYTKLANQEMRVMPPAWKITLRQIPAGRLKLIPTQGLIDEDLLTTTDTMNVATNTGRKHVFSELKHVCENGGVDPDTLIKRFGAACRVFGEPHGNHATFQWNFGNN